jgi:hypothetical protein
MYVLAIDRLPIYPSGQIQVLGVIDWRFATEEIGHIRGCDILVECGRSASTTRLPLLFLRANDHDPSAPTIEIILKDRQVRSWFNGYLNLAPCG